MTKQIKKKKKKVNKKNATKIILMTDEETDDDIDEEEDDESGMYFEKEDVQLIYNALKNYKPAVDEQALYETWLEMFEEMLVVDFKVKLLGFEDLHEEDE